MTGNLVVIFVKISRACCIFSLRDYPLLCVSRTVPGMKPSSVASPSTSVDVAANCRAALARGRISSSRLSRVYGGAHSYWTRRISGDLPLSDSDIQLIALACEIHPAELFGGAAPLGWTAPPSPLRVTNRYYPAAEMIRFGNLIPSQRAITSHAA